jgi:hypothetical protein
MRMGARFAQEPVGSPMRMGARFAQEPATSYQPRHQNKPSSPRTNKSTFFNTLDKPRTAYLHKGVEIKALNVRAFHASSRYPHAHARERALERQLYRRRLDLVVISQAAAKAHTIEGGADVRAGYVGGQRPLADHL